MYCSTVSRSSINRKKQKAKCPAKYSAYLLKQKMRSQAARNELKAELAKEKPAQWAVAKREHLKSKQRVRNSIRSTPN